MLVYGELQKFTRILMEIVAIVYEVWNRIGPDKPLHLVINYNHMYISDVLTCKY